MTTKAPSPIQPSGPDTMETMAYECVAGIPTQEPHDLDRLGYTLWLWLKHRKDPLEIAVRSAGARILISEHEAVSRIRERLKAKGIQL